MGNNDRLNSIEIGEDNTAYDAEHYLAVARAIQTANFSYPRFKIHSNIEAALRKSSVITKLGKNFSWLGSSLVHIERVNTAFSTTANTAQSLSSGFKFSGFILSVVDFIRIPAVYFLTWRNEKKVQFSKSQNAKWFHASIALTLAIIGMALPVVATPLSLVSVSLGVIVGTFLLVRALYYKPRIATQLKNITLDAARQEYGLSFMQLKAAELEFALEKAIKVGDKDTITRLSAEIGLLEFEVVTARSELQHLYNMRIQLEKKQVKLSGVALIDQTVGVVLSLVAVLGLSLLLVNPPVGAIVLAASAGVGILYMLGRLAFPWLSALIKSAKIYNHDPGLSSPVIAIKKLLEQKVPAPDISFQVNGDRLQETRIRGNHTRDIVNNEVETNSIVVSQNTQSAFSLRL